MQIQSIFFGFLLILTFYFNLYKLPLMAKTPYKVYPWSQSPQLAKTSPHELQAHLVTALALYVCAFVRYLFPKSKPIMVILIALQSIFTIIILPNLQNFGDAPAEVAYIINGGLLLALWLVSLHSTPTHYLILLSIPVMFEVALWLRVVLGLMKYILFEWGALYKPN